ncbi:hypothetical protein D3C84_1006840 [compost metagenome]
MIDQLRLGFDDPVGPDANRKAALDRQRHGIAFTGLALALFGAAVAIDPAAAGAQVHVPAGGAGQAPIRAEARACQVQGIFARFGHRRRYQLATSR